MGGITRRDFLRATLTAAAVGVVGQTSACDSSSRAQARPFLAYSADSYFKGRVDGAPIDQTRTTVFRSFMKRHPHQRDHPHPRINGTEGNPWGTPYAMSSASDPIWKLAGEVSAECALLRTRGFHAPEWLGSMLTGTSDSPFCVIDRAFGVTVFCEKATQIGVRTISVLSAGITYHNSNGLDQRNPRSDSQQNFTSRGRISDAMVIREDLVDYAVANDTDLGHVLHMYFVETRTSDGFRHPMVGTEQGKYGFGAEGERIAISPNVDVATRGLSPEALVVARTLQNYGCYLGDNSGSQSALKAEQENGDRPIWKGRLDRDALEGLSWDDFVVLR